MGLGQHKGIVTLEKFVTVMDNVQICVQNMQKMEHMEMEMAMVEETVKQMNFVIMRALAKLNVQNVASMEGKVMERVIPKETA